MDKVSGFIRPYTLFGIYFGVRRGVGDIEEMTVLGVTVYRRVGSVKAIGPFVWDSGRG